MKINDIIINADLRDILVELKHQLEINNVKLLEHIVETDTDIMVSCPYHKNGQERKPSAGIRKSDGLLHCFTCGETHTLDEVISYCLGYTNDVFGIHGKHWLLKNFATISIEERKSVKLNITRNRDITTTVNNRKLVTDEELDKYRYYHYYWTKRGIIDEELIELFDLGYDKETDCITFPIRDECGNCLFVARRSVNTKYFNYPAKAEKPLYGAYELRLLSACSQPKEIYVTESMIDALLLWQSKKYAVALNGTGSKEQLEMLSKLPYRGLILATDNDDAGRNARVKIRNKIKNKIISEVELPKNRKDIGECTKDEIENLKIKLF